jgi:hypothetical protein
MTPSKPFILKRGMAMSMRDNNNGARTCAS